MIEDDVSLYRIKSVTKIFPVLVYNLYEEGKISSMDDSEQICCWLRHQESALLRNISRFGRAGVTKMCGHLRKAPSILYK